MEIGIFIENIKKAFGEITPLPFAFGYADKPASGCLEKINGCFFKEFGKLLNREAITLSSERIGCMGGKFYTGFSAMGERVPTFVSCKEKYKQSPEMFIEFVGKSDVQLATKPYLNIRPMEQLESFDGVEGIFFLATPDVISGLASWAFFDNNADDAVTAKFGSGCSSIFSEAVAENRRNGRRTFLGLFDPSVRCNVGMDTLSFTIPMSRFKEMYQTLPESCLSGTHAWTKVKGRICGK